METSFKTRMYVVIGSISLTLSVQEFPAHMKTYDNSKFIFRKISLEILQSNISDQN